MKITPDSLRAARALLNNVSQTDLAKSIGIPRTKIVQYENRWVDSKTSKEYKLGYDALEKIHGYFKARGIRFTENEGVERIPKNEVRLLSGISGFKALMDDVYAHAKNFGGPIEILNGSPDLFIKWLGQEWYADHAARMLEVKDRIQFRIIVDEDQEQLIAREFAEYRRIPKEAFNTQTVYIYGHNIAVFTFSDHDLDIDISNRPGLAKTLRLAFDLFWEWAE